jgi:hypothetical protein
MSSSPGNSAGRPEIRNQPPTVRGFLPVNFSKLAKMQAYQKIS